MENHIITVEENYLDCLNEQQRAAVEYCEGPQLVIAGAGSGKTRVLTYKIVHLLNMGMDPWRILALTFTNKAAREMRERIELLVGPAVSKRLWMGTFHSIFARLLRSSAERIGFKSNFTIYDSTDSKNLVKSIIKDMDLDDKIYKPSVVANAISTAKNALISPERYATLEDVMKADRDARRPMIHAIYRHYRDRLFTAGAMDFDDLLYYTNVLLRDNPDILQHYREMFQYVLVDEYQDTNFAQHLIVSQLAPKETGHLCVVGDDAQSIYSFRGANIRNIIGLKNSYPNLRTFKLEQNYRSTQNITNAANSLIAKNIEQIPKNVFSKNDPGKPIEVMQAYSDYEEGNNVAQRISQVYHRGNDSFEEFAILYRTNAQSRILEEALRKRNIPYRIYGGLSFYQRKEIKDAIAYFRLVINPDDDEALRRIINYPARGIGDTTLGRLTRTALDNQVSIWQVLVNSDNFDTGISAAPMKKLKNFQELIEGFISLYDSGADAYEVASNIIGRTQLLSSLISDRTPESISKQENLSELMAGVKEFVESRREEESTEWRLNDFLAEVSLATDQDNQEDASERVTMMTVHAAKGLEFNNVFVVGVEEELFPSSMAVSPQEVEEERRLLYVALTRARKFCMLSYASSRFRNGQTMITSPSRFLGEIDQQYLNLSMGTNIFSGASSAGSFGAHFSGGGYGGYSYKNRSGVNPVDKYRRSEKMNTTPVYPQRSRYDIPSNPDSHRTTEKKAHPTSQPTFQSVSSVGQAPGTHRISELREGMVIEHSRFGRGTIVALDASQADDRISVEFDSDGKKTIMLKYAHFNIVK